MLKVLDIKEIKIEVNIIETICLFGKDIELGKTNIVCDDMYISNIEELENNTDIKEVVLKSKSNNLLYMRISKLLSLNIL